MTYSGAGNVTKTTLTGGSLTLEYTIMIMTTMVIPNCIPMI